MLDGFVIPATIKLGVPQKSARIRKIVCLMVYTDGAVHFDIRTVARNHVESPVQRHSFRISEIGSISYQKARFGGRIVMRPIHLAALDSIPGAEHGELILQIRRSDREQADKLIGRVRRDLSDSRM
ncbi:MAG: hypothetical protein KDD65_04345 [Bacteroidetes bacterium]|nr:hypothetical protein [Bacteroidota bacterium]